MEISRGGQQGQVTSYTSDMIENKVNQASEVNTSNVVAGQSNSSTSNSNDKAINEKDLKKAVDRLNKFVEEDNVSVEYEIHPQFKDVMLKIVDKKTGDILVEVPPRKILDMVAKMCEIAGVIFDKKA